MHGDWELIGEIPQIGETSTNTIITVFNWIAIPSMSRINVAYDFEDNKWITVLNARNAWECLDYSVELLQYVEIIGQGGVTADIE